MKTYRVVLESPVARSFRCTKAADSLDIDAHKKARHELVVEADLDAPFNIGLIVGSSGSGKTTLAKQVYGDDCLRELLRPELPVIDQLPRDFSYDDCVAALSGVGLTHVPCWIRPAHTLSNGQRARAECALQLAASSDERVTVIDEWTSVVDRTVAKVMSHCVQKHARRAARRIVLCSCHFDVIEWLNPDWVINCNEQSFTDRRSLWRDFKRSEALRFEIREAPRSTWRGFSRYHYLSEQLPGGLIRTFGLFSGDDQIGFQCFANYVPKRRHDKFMQMHSNRTVIHPDFAGLGLGILLINETSAIMAREGFDVRAKFSSLPVFKAMARQSCWIHERTERKHKQVVGGAMLRKDGFRLDVTTYSFRFSLPRFDDMKGTP